MSRGKLTDFKCPHPNCPFLPDVN